jgi:hypothetical protein
MVKMKNQNNSKEIAFTESQSLRNDAIETTNVDFLDRIKAVQYLNDSMVMSIDHVANYYETSKESVSTIIKRNRDEFESDGMQVLVGEELKDFKENLIGSNELNKINRSLTLLQKRSLLRVGLIMTNNAVASKIRNYLLNLEEVATEEQKKWAIQREVGIIERKRLTSTISKYIPNTKHKKFAFPNYTNMIYRALFGCDAKSLREQRNVKTNDALRDSFTEKELFLVEEAEGIVRALIALAFTYKQIEEQLQQKYIKQISSK